mmetsp:Transcript_128071/g.410451  ORF Transcript_128071/g.410451 Transcript_128071/m.410451 type:complete len:532 (-) Transcript_128071:57-1652(-)
MSKKASRTSTKRKGSKQRNGFGGASAAEVQATPAQGGRAACDSPPPAASRVRDGAFCVRSSLGVPFLVVSDRGLVSGLPTPSPEEWKELLALCSDLTKQWESRGAVVLSDFEGEFMGIEGELVSASFQRSLCLDPQGLRPLPAGSAVSRDMGLLVDFRCEAGVALAKRIMESDSLCKAIWGADGDVSSLRYTPVTRPLGVQSANVLDVQLAYSDVGKRLSMANMLKRLPPKSVAGLPDKVAAGGMDFTAAQARHRRALELPMAAAVVQYAVDDLHRLEAVLRTQKPAGGNYLQARSRSSAVVSAILKSPAGLSTEKLRAYGEKLKKSTGEQRLAIAVRTKRHLLALRHLLAAAGSDEATTVGIIALAAGAQYANLEDDADRVLAEASVSVPTDLAFPPDGKAAEKEGEKQEEADSGSGPGEVGAKVAVSLGGRRDSKRLRRGLKKRNENVPPVEPESLQRAKRKMEGASQPTEVQAAEEPLPMRGKNKRQKIAAAPTEENQQEQEQEQKQETSEAKVATGKKQTKKRGGAA